jgi:3-methyladenine DNA glycosylase AlkD
MNCTNLIAFLKTLGDAKVKAGMARFGVQTELALGISVPPLRKKAALLKKDFRQEPEKLHALALELWESKIHEARILAAFIGRPELVTTTLMEKWVLDFNSWDVCDQVCGNLFDKTPFAYSKAVEWCIREEEYVKRAGFVLMAVLAVHDKTASDTNFTNFYPYLEQEASDNRNFVKKALNWAIRQIGKRNSVLNKSAIDLSNRILMQETKSAKWIAGNALTELKSEDIQAALLRKRKRTIY